MANDSGGLLSAIYNLFIGICYMVGGLLMMVGSILIPIVVIASVLGFVFGSGSIPFLNMQIGGDLAGLFSVFKNLAVTVVAIIVFYLFFTGKLDAFLEGGSSKQDSSNQTYSSSSRSTNSSSRSTSKSSPSRSSSSRSSTSSSSADTSSISSNTSHSTSSTAESPKPDSKPDVVSSDSSAPTDQEIPTLDEGEEPDDAGRI